MAEMFHLGGPFMWAILVMGVLTVGAASRYAVRPTPNQFPLILALGGTTMLFGLLGTVMGVSKSLLVLNQVKADEHWISLIGLGESLQNTILAVGLAGIAALAVTVGAWRVARAPGIAAQPAL
jgi:biopolymer transport protein ExbB/TolQ